MDGGNVRQRLHLAAEVRVALPSIHVRGGEDGVLDQRPLVIP